VGCAHSVQTGRPLLSSALATSVNTAMLSFTFLGTSLLLSRASPSLLPTSSLPNQVLAGAVMLSLLSGWQRAAKGEVTTRQDATRVGVKGFVSGAVLGAGVWGVRRVFSWWMVRRADREECRRQREVEREEEHMVRGSSGADSGDIPMPHWIPVRVSTLDDLQRDAAMKERRRQRARDEAERSNHQR
jgi:hypothetical protein